MPMPMSTLFRGQTEVAQKPTETKPEKKKKNKKKDVYKLNLPPST